MIGNDVVDLVLAKAESNWQRKGYLDKIYTKFEQNLIKTSNNPDEMIWILWSLKESTYKAYQRINYNKGFYPIKIKIESLQLIDTSYYASISLFEMSFSGITNIENTMVHSIVVATKNDFKKISNYTKNKITKDQNLVPYCSVSKNPISISHHGNFIKKVQLHL